MSIEIKIEGNRAYISGDFPLKKIKELTSYVVPNYWFSKKYKKGVWDGRINLFRKKDSSFPAGLVESVVRYLKKAKHKVRIIDHRNEVQKPIRNGGFDLNTIEFGKGKYDYQLIAAQACIDKKRGILKMATNAGKTSVAAAVTQHLGLTTLFVVPSLVLLKQSRQAFAKYIGISEETLGQIGDNVFEIGEWITFITIDSLYARRKELQEYFDKVDLLWIDECHVVGADTAFKALDKINAFYRFGLSGTPLDRTDGATLRLIAQTGEIICEISNKELIERGVSVQPYVEVFRVEKPYIAKKTHWATVYRKGITENTEFNDKVAFRADLAGQQGDQCIVMVEQKKHGQQLADQIAFLSKNMYSVVYMDGDAPTQIREEVLQQFNDLEINVLVVTPILNTGVDLDCIDVIIFAGGGKSPINALQRAGRGLRTGRGRDRVTIVVPINFCNEHLLKHSQAQIEIFKKENCFIFVTSDESVNFKKE